MRRLDRHARLEIVASQALGVGERTTVSAHEGASAAWAVAADGSGEITMKVGGARSVGVALAVARGARWPLIAWRAPLRLLGAPWLLDRLYGLVATNRRRLPGDTPWCVEHPDGCFPDGTA